MSEAHIGGIEIDETRLDWDEITEIAGDLFDVQDGGLGGLQWVKSAWEVLSEVGLTRYLLEVERTVCILRFIALFASYSEFCVRAFDEGNAGDWQYIAPAGLIGDYPLVDAFSLGNSRSEETCSSITVLPEFGTSRARSSPCWRRRSTGKS